MKRVAAIVLALLFNASLFAGQTAPQATPDNPNRNTSDPRSIATAPPGNPVKRIYIPERPDITHDYEDWHIEFTFTYWPLKASGSVETLSAPADISNDLGIQGYKSLPVGRMTLKLRRKHELTIEGIPFRFSGGNVLNREVDLNGHTFVAHDQIASQINLSYVNASYQYDLISNHAGFFGLLLGGGFLEANSKVTAVSNGVEALNHARAFFPMVGGAFRDYPLKSNRLNFNGEIKGMDFGNDGSFLQSTVRVGLSFTHKTTFQVGYMQVNANVHNKYETEGVSSTLREDRCFRCSGEISRRELHGVRGTHKSRHAFLRLKVRCRTGRCQAIVEFSDPNQVPGPTLGVGSVEDKGRVSPHLELLQKHIRIVRTQKRSDLKGIL